MNALNPSEAKLYLYQLRLVFLIELLTRQYPAAMPRSAPTPCRHPACALVLDKPGYCDEHRPQVHRDYGRARRGFDSELGFYQSARWREVRAAFLREHPLCVACKGAGLVVVAKVADHIRPLKDGGARFDTANLQALCVSCHNRKTARETAGRR